MKQGERAEDGKQLGFRQLKSHTYQTESPVPLDEPRPGRGTEGLTPAREARWEPRLRAQRDPTRRAAGKAKRQQREAGARPAARPARPEALGADGPVGPAASKGLSGRRGPATLPGEGEIGTGPRRGEIRRRAIASLPPGAEGGGAPPLYPRGGGGGCPHAAGGAPAPCPGRSRRPPRPVPGGRARDSPAPGAPLRAAGPLTATALPLGELPACHSSPHAYWCSVSAASLAPPCRARRAGIPIAPPPAGPRRAHPPGSHWLQPPLVFPRRAGDWLRAVRPASLSEGPSAGWVWRCRFAGGRGAGWGPAPLGSGLGASEAEVGAARTCGIAVRNPPVWLPGLSCCYPERAHGNRLFVLNFAVYH
ncbi:unnamed protein product [Coccothraustes coccothraustes]